MKTSSSRTWRVVLGWVCICQLLTACSLPLLRPPEPSPLAPSSRQLVIVHTQDWGSTTGTLQRYQRDPPSARWLPAGPPIPVVVGRNGLGWGIGLNTEPEPGDAPLKREGDGKAPAGAFTFNNAFGYAPPGSVPQIRMPYVQAQSTYRCVDDAGSRYYNRLLFEDRTEKDWTSSEEMLRPDDQYRLGLVVEHNWEPRTQSGKGSCIFLHIWYAPDKGTAGCTAMAPADMESLLSWLDPALHPILVQLPQSEYDRLRKAWGLP
jgi:L,D-peptidoglycan transpeptidase YkuD (ErfK/YbiS/YcfS/YnhG family)